MYKNNAFALRNTLQPRLGDPQSCQDQTVVGDLGSADI